VANIKIAVINSSTVLSDDQVKAAVSDLQTQVHRDFAPIWGIDADLTFFPSGNKPPTSMWWIAILDDSDQAGALGYHDLTEEGLPLGKVFAASDKKYGYQWTITASHELLEMLADPDINLTVFDQKDEKTGTLYAFEICDACEADQYGYKINNTLASDFVYPAWFGAFRKKGNIQLDYGNHIDRPFKLLPGGYIGAYDVTAGSGWHQKTADAKPGRYVTSPRLVSRREKRQTIKNQWQKSQIRNLKHAC